MAAIFTAFVQLVHGGDRVRAAKPMASAVFATVATLAAPLAPDRPNILALAFDDLRPWFLVSRATALPPATALARPRLECM